MNTIIRIAQEALNKIRSNPAPNQNQSSQTSDKNKMLVSLDQLRAIFPSTHPDQLAKYLGPINVTMNNYGITKPSDIAMFLAQVGHECMEFKVFEENLNYSAQGLLKVFPKYFNPNTANQYARKPEAIANRVYGNRMGNGPESSGDGWRYRGRGAIQLTGKNNYVAFASAHKIPLDHAIQWLNTPDGHMASAGWFWKANRLSEFSSDNIVTMTEFVTATTRINGGKNGLDHRTQIWGRAKKALGI